MSELLLTSAGLVIGVLIAAYSVLDDRSKSGSAKAVLIGLTILGLAVGVWGAILQRGKSNQAERDFNDLRSKVGDVANLDSQIQEKNNQIQEKVNNLTVLDRLGDSHYYVIIDTFQNNGASTKDYDAVRGRLLVLFPDAEKNNLLWKCPVSGGQYELRLGKDLTLSAAEIIRGLAAGGGLSNGAPLIRRRPCAA